MKKLFATFSLIMALTTTNALSKERVLVLFNKQGSLNITSSLLMKGMDLAKKDWSERVKAKYEFDFVALDGTLEGTLKKAGEAISTKKPVLLYGAISSNQAFMINAVSKKYGIPFITPFATHPKVTEANSLTFRTCFDDLIQAKKMAGFAYKARKLKKGLALVNRSQSYAIGLSQNFGKQFSKFKGTTFKEIRFISADDFKGSLLAEIKRYDPEFILLPSYQIESATIISKLLPTFHNKVFIGPDSWGGGRLFHNILKDNPHKFNGYYVQHYSPLSKTKENKKFLSLVKSDEELSRYKSAAMLAPIAIGFDSQNFLYKVLENTHLKEMTKKIQATLHTGATGSVDLTKSRTTDKNIFVYKITNTQEELYVRFE